MLRYPKTRRQLLAFAALALPLGCKPVAPQAAPAPRKKGLCLTTKKRSPQELTQHLESVGARWLYYRPIWITEFAVGDWEAKSPEENRHEPERIADFVSELLPRLEAMDIVERYSWFHSGIASGPLGTSSLFNSDGSLTVVGEVYRSVG